MNNTLLFESIFLGIHHYLTSIILSQKINLFPKLFVHLIVDTDVFLAIITSSVSYNLEVKEAERSGERERTAALSTILTGPRQFPHIYC